MGNEGGGGDPGMKESHFACCLQQGPRTTEALVRRLPANARTRGNQGHNDRCGYKVTGMTLLQANLYTYSALRGVTFDVIPSVATHLAQLLETFLELLLWNKFQRCRHFFLCLS